MPGKTYGQAVKLAEQAAITVDPDSAARRRQDAERNSSRVTMFREESGAAALSGRDMPTGQTLAAHASVSARAQEYAEPGAFPDDIRMDQYRVAAYLDLLNGVAAFARIASGVLPGAHHDGDGGGAGEADAGGPPTAKPDSGGHDRSGRRGNGHRVKQSPGWNVTQPRPGWHRWVTPSGRAYLRGPKRYPA